MVTVQLIDVERRAAADLLSALAPFVTFSAKSDKGDCYNIELNCDRLTFYALKREILFVANSNYTHELLYNEFRDIHTMIRGVKRNGKR